jgi:hypothetical protein
LKKTLKARLDDIPLTGKIDRIDLYAPEGTHVHVIDYKTGTPKTARAVREDRGGAMFRQLVFYKLLTELSPSFVGYDATECSLDFIGERDNEPSLLTFTITPQDVRDLRDLIAIVWAKIKALDFTALS